jgi:hypothetical protein
MAHPRFQLRVVRRRILADPDGRRLIADGRPVGRDDRIVWRLLGANNRELGRSGDQFASVEDGLVAIDRLRAFFSSQPSVTPSLASSHDHGFVWWWTVRAGNEVLASAARSFSRQVECLKNYETFSGVVLSAEVLTESMTRAALDRSISIDRQGVS